MLNRSQDADSCRLRPEIVPAIVEKALGNSRAGTKKKGTELCATFVEVENTGEGVVVSHSGRITG